jgi:hypothetical protein
MAGYCEVDDLLIGQIKTRMPPTVSPEDFIEHASHEIDSKLGFIYVVPFVDPATVTPVPDPDTRMPAHQWHLIKDIAIKLASGRIIMAVTGHTENNAVHAYGYHLVRDAEITLMAIANGEVRLSVARVDSEGNPLEPAPNPQDTDPLAYIPGASNDDAVSAVKAFEQNYMTPSGWPFEVETWYPGA